MNHRRLPQLWAVLLFCVLSGLPLCRVGAESASRDDWPITINLSTVIYPVPGKAQSWNLSVNSAGRAQLVIGLSGPNTVEFTLPPERLKEITRLVEEQKFFKLTLDDAHDYAPVHSPEVTLTISHAAGGKTIQLANLEPQPNEPAARRNERARFLRVLLAIRRCFTHPEAVDFTESSERILRELEKNKGP